MALWSKIWREIRSPWERRLHYYKLKLRFHGIVRFGTTARIAPDSIFEGANSIGESTLFHGKLGYGSYVGSFSHIEASVGRFTSIGCEVRTSRGTHPLTTPFATTSPVFYSLEKQAMISFAKKQCFDEVLPEVQIGNDCWICDRAQMVGGVKIGDGAVLLPGAVVNKDVPPYAIVGGVPARVIRYRYDGETISWLLRIKWWERPVEWLADNASLICDLDKLRSLYE